MSNAPFPKELTERYKPEHVLGSGANGVVYRAQRLFDNRLVAIKVLSDASPDPAAVDRFAREAKIARKDLHPALVQVFESGVADSCHYIVSELVTGQTLRSFIRQKGKLNERRTLEIGAEVAACLGKLHEIGIVHRDIKPENIMLDSQGRVRVLDLGIARMADSGERLTKTGMIVGTIMYLAPEQCRFREAKPAADVFALGLVMLECLVPQIINRGKACKPGEFMVARATGKEVLSIPPQIEAATANMLRKCLAFEADGRFQDGNELRSAINEVARIRCGLKREVTVTAEAVAETKEQIKPVSTHQRTHFIVCALLFLVSVGFITWRRSSKEQVQEKAESIRFHQAQEALEKYEQELQRFWRNPRERASSSTLRNPPKEVRPNVIRMKIAVMVSESMQNTFSGRVSYRALPNHVTRLIGFLDLFQRLPGDEDPFADAKALLEMVIWSRLVVDRMIVLERGYARRALKGKILGKWGSLARLVDPNELKEFSRLQNQLKAIIDRDSQKRRDALLPEILHIECSYQSRHFEKCFRRLTLLQEREAKSTSDEKLLALRSLPILVVRAVGLRRTRDIGKLQETFDEALTLMTSVSSSPFETTLHAVNSIAATGLHSCIFDTENPRQIELTCKYVDHVLSKFIFELHRPRFKALLRDIVLKSRNQRLKKAVVKVIDGSTL